MNIYMSLSLKRFNMNRITDDSVIVMIGKRNTGKSFLTKDLLYHHQNIPAGTVISPTENANKFYSNIIPPIFIHDEYQPKITNEFMKRQKQLKRRIVQGDSDIDNRAFLIMDDCLYDNDWKCDKTIREIFLNGRHWGIMFILSMQYAIGITPILRSNIDWVFILRENIVANRKKLYDNYAGMFPTFDMFCQTMDACTENYECLVIHNASKSNKIEDQVFWYKAENHSNFIVCCPEAWRFSEENYNPDDEDIDENITDLIKKKNKVNIKIKKSY
jgi:hypothetical protein